MKMPIKDTNYFIDDLGNVYNIKGHTLSTTTSKKGYFCVDLWKNNKRKRKRVHRLVMETFKPTDDSTLQVDHIDGNKRNNKLNNLEWVTCKENINRAWENKLCENTRTNALSRGVKVKQILNGNVIKVWGSISEAQRALGLHHISDACNSNKPKYKHCGGFRWEVI